MLSFWRQRGRVRPWISMVAAYALVLQALLGAILVSESAAAGNDPFAICLSAGTDGPADHSGTGKAPVAHDNCALCTLAKVAHAILGAGHAGTLPDFVFSSIARFQTTDRVVAFHSPTGQHQRGPPQAA